MTGSLPRSRRVRTHLGRSAVGQVDAWMSTKSDRSRAPRRLQDTLDLSSLAAESGRWYPSIQRCRRPLAACPSPRVRMRRESFVERRRNAEATLLRRGGAESAAAPPTPSGSRRRPLGGDQDHFSAHLDCAASQREYRSRPLLSFSNCLTSLGFLTHGRQAPQLRSSTPMLRTHLPSLGGWPAKPGGVSARPTASPAPARAPGRCRIFTRRCRAPALFMLRARAASLPKPVELGCSFHSYALDPRSHST